MITKERLKKLIKEGATIWALGRYAFQDKIEEIKLDEDFFSVSNSALIYPDLFATKLEDLFETKKQAEWALKYHATRTEELDLPMWEDLPLVFGKSFVTRNSAYYLSSSKPQDNISLIKYKNIMLFPCLDMGLEQIYVGRLTEQNYIKACDLCLKLFEGEE